MPLLLSVMMMVVLEPNLGDPSTVQPFSLGAVSTVTGATPLWVRMGFMRMRRRSDGSGSISPSATR